jgi:DNA-binding transcriptional regulator YhcF (GntR family)
VTSKEKIINGYSICFNEWALDKTIKSELGLLLIISGLCAERGYCFASNEYFSNLFDVDEVTISRKLKKLEKKGYIKIMYSRNGYRVENREIRLTKMSPSINKNVNGAINKNVNGAINKNVKYNNTSNNITIINNTSNNNDLVFPFDSDEFLETWKLWKDYRMEIKKPFKGVISEQSQLKKLSKLSNGDQQTAIEIINQSISNNWQGLFEIKKQKSNSTDVAMKLIQDIENGDFEI